MEHIRNNIFNTLICIFFFTICSAQITSNKKGGIDCCVNAQLKEIGKSIVTPTLLKGSGNFKSNNYSINIDNNSLLLKGKSTQVVLSNTDNIKSWIEVANLESLRVYNLTYRNSDYFLFSSKVIGATGLAVNFYQWLIIDANLHTAITTDIVSLSDDARMVFIKDNVLTIKVFKYGDDFYFKERDWDNPPIKVTTYRLKNNTLKKVSQIDTVCKCQ